MTPRHIAVLDVGKTNVKLVLVEAATLREVRAFSRPNHVLQGPPYPHYDTEGIWQFLLEGLHSFQAAEGVDAITCSAHGASGVLMAADGALAAPVLDYEHDGPDALAEQYEKIRPDFAQTGSPRLPRGLNVGAQIHWQFARDPDLAKRVVQFVTYPQYWTGRLSGVFTTEMSSLGAHTDLWSPHAKTFSPLIARLGLEGRMARLEPADTVLGPVLPWVARATGLSAGTPVISGLHDSNASLYPHLLARAAPFTVVSSGTWVIAMAIGSTATLDPSRDTLVNVSARGEPVPSARFMGGREFETICGHDACVATPADIASVLARKIMLFPAFEPTSGPFPGRAPGCSHDRAVLTKGEIKAAASLYLAMMTATCLALIGSEGQVIVEGPFARNATFLDMLTVASGLPCFAADGATGTAGGAALLAGFLPPDRMEKAPRAPENRSLLSEYAEVWRAVVSG